ncbi:MAG: sigma-70 family RNA polymerase sigma factor [Propionibacteriaceae bacterium]|jgi:DNA-directed RNA polymerase specialized sigma24 family protein|nr:sigma-70 family RNA polymerase sigma factor [Propionibacteriaceae bacterium]
MGDLDQTDQRSDSGEFAAPEEREPETQEPSIPETELDTATLSDQQLIRSTRAGSPAAFDELWRRHSAIGLVAASAEVPEQAEEICEEAWILILDDILADGGPPAGFRPYLYATIHQLTTEPRDNPAVTTMVEAFDTLPPTWQEILWYRDIEKMTTREIIQLLGLSENEITNIQSRARRALTAAWVKAHADRVPANSPCQWAREHIRAHLRKTLSDAESLLITDHLANCPECTAICATARTMGTQVQTLLLTAYAGPVIAATLTIHFKVHGAWNPNESPLPEPVVAALAQTTAPPSGDTPAGDGVLHVLTGVDFPDPLASREYIEPEPVVVEVEAEPEEPSEPVVLIEEPPSVEEEEEEPPARPPVIPPPRPPSPVKKPAPKPGRDRTKLRRSTIVAICITLVVLLIVGLTAAALAFDWLSPGSPTKTQNPPTTGPTSGTTVPGDPTSDPLPPESTTPPSDGVCAITKVDTGTHHTLFPIITGTCAPLEPVTVQVGSGSGTDTFQITSDGRGLWSVDGPYPSIGAGHQPVFIRGETSQGTDTTSFLIAPPPTFRKSVSRQIVTLYIKGVIGATYQITVDGVPQYADRNLPALLESTDGTEGYVTVAINLTPGQHKIGVYYASANRTGFQTEPELVTI